MLTLHRAPHRNEDVASTSVPLAGGLPSHNHNTPTLTLNADDRASVRPAKLRLRTSALYGQSSLEEH